MVFARVNLHFFQRNSTFHQGAREFLDRLHDVFRGIEVHIGVTLGPSVENVVQPRLDKNMDLFNGKMVEKSWENLWKKNIMVKKNGATRHFLGFLTVLPTCFDVEFSHTGQILPNETANDMRSPALTPMTDLQQTQMGNSLQEKRCSMGIPPLFWGTKKTSDLRNEILPMPWLCSENG